MVAVLNDVSLDDSLKSGNDVKEKLSVLINITDPKNRFQKV